VPQGVATVVFDLGGVLVDWNPRYLYRRLFPGDEPALERFVALIMEGGWMLSMDAGVPMAEAVERLAALHPEHAAPVRAYLTRWREMYNGAFPETVALLERLHAQGVPLYALTNWSAETFPAMRPHYPFLERFRGIVVSGEEGLVKPDPRLYRVLLERHGLDARRTLFIDDSPANVAAAAALGFVTHHHRSAEALAARLAGLGLL